MCFYDQYQFACGDSKFGHFKRRCHRVNQPGRSCSLKLANEIFQLQKKCSLCNKIAANRHGQQREWDRIDVWQSKEQVNDKAVQHSISIINQLQHEILTLELERRGRRVTAPDDDLEKNGSAGLGPAVESADLVATSIASLFTSSGSSPPLAKSEEGREREDGKSSLSRAPPSAPRASDIARACTFFALDVFGELVSVQACVTR